MINLLPKIASFIVLIILLTQTASVSQTADTTGATEFKFYFYPYAFYTPETEIAIGAGAVSYFRNRRDSLNNPSKITLTGYYSFRNQYSISLLPEFYFKRNQYLLDIESNVGKFADKFWGIGNETPDIETADYIRQAYSALINFQKKIHKNYRGGILLELKNSVIKNRQDNPFLQNNSLPGSQKGVTVGVGVSLAHDSRNSIFFPVTGTFLELQSTFYLTGLGSNFNYQRFLLNYRKYLPLKENHTIAFQVYGNFTAGTVPFFELPFVGGPLTMRGYFQGRYRDKHFFTTQLEYRTILLWRLGLAAFAGIGDVSDKIDDWSVNEMKHTIGAGLRYVVDQKENVTVRIDFAFGRNSSGLYFAVEEAF